MIFQFINNKIPSGFNDIFYQEQNILSFYGARRNEVIQYERRINHSGFLITSEPDCIHNPIIGVFGIEFIQHWIESMKDCRISCASCYRYIHIGE